MSESSNTLEALKEMRRKAAAWKSWLEKQESLGMPFAINDPDNDGRYIEFPAPGLLKDAFVSSLDEHIAMIDKAISAQSKEKHSSILRKLFGGGK